MRVYSVLVLAGSAENAAEEAARTVGTKTARSGLDLFEEAEHLKAAQDCQMPAAARSRPSDSGPRRELAPPYPGCLEMAVDIVADSEDLGRMTGFDKVLDS